MRAALSPYPPTRTLCNVGRLTVISRNWSRSNSSDSRHMAAHSRDHRRLLKLRGRGERRARRRGRRGRRGSAGGRRRARAVLVFLGRRPMTNATRASLIVIALLTLTAAASGAAEEKQSKDLPLPANAHEQLAVDMIGFLQDVTAVVVTVTDKASAEASGAKFDAPRARAIKLWDRTGKLGKPNDAVRDAMMKKLGPRLQESTKAMMKQRQRIEDDEQLAALMKPNLDKLKV